MNSKLKEKEEVRRDQPSKLSSETLNKGKVKKLYSMMFEIYGRVQGVYFRKHTQIKAKELGLYGWCMNTKDGTVKGIVEGPVDLISEMRIWLQHKGSPRSIIEKAVFTSNEPISAYNFNKFTIKR
ncbi:GH11746 [Drosophila grimshawi]|uniref:Acylphosphatase n=1 Tax=Drosophila grimshawi TaxID=7222 RepID=B4K2X3_DROGR|nr:GH11746 [Drosophila grimshawi]